MEPEVMRQIVSSLLVMALLTQSWFPLTTAPHRHQQQQQPKDKHSQHPHHNPSPALPHSDRQRHPASPPSADRQHQHHQQRPPAQQNAEEEGRGSELPLVHPSGHRQHTQRQRAKSVSYDKDSNTWTPEPLHTDPLPERPTEENVHYRPSSPHLSRRRRPNLRARTWTEGSWEHALEGAETWTTASRDPALGRRPAETRITIPPEPMGEEDLASSSDAAPRPPSPPPPSPDYEARIQPFPPRKPPPAVPSPSKSQNAKKNAEGKQPTPCETMHTKAGARRVLQKVIIKPGTDCRQAYKCDFANDHHILIKCPPGFRYGIPVNKVGDCLPDEFVDCINDQPKMTIEYDE